MTLEDSEVGKTYLVEELFQDIEGDPDNVIFNIPPEICESIGWTAGDTIKFRVENGSLYLEKVQSKGNKS